MRKPARKQGRSAQVDVIDLTNVRASAPLKNVESGTRPWINACSATADELAASRTLIDALDEENTTLKARLETEKRSTQLLTELNETRKTETEALRSAIGAKNEALMAEDAVIAVQDKLIDTLKGKKSSPWKRLGDVLIGVGIGVLL